MTTLDDLLASVRASVETIGQQSYIQGKADQALTDAAALAACREQVLDLEKRVDELQHEIDSLLAPPVVLGSAAVPDTSVTWETAYNQQVAACQVAAGYFYGQAAPTYSQIDGVPADHDVMFQHAGSARAAFDATFATFPATRAGKVYAHIKNEIDRQVHTGKLTLQQAQANMDAEYASIASSGKPYLVPTLGVQIYALEQAAAGSTLPEWQVANYVRPGLKHVLFSGFADPKVKADGHAYYQGDPAKRAGLVDTFMAQHPGLTWSLVTGYDMPTAELSDPISLANRVEFLQKVYDAYMAMKCPPVHILWFDQLWPTGDERLSEPTLLAKWHSLIVDVGQ